MSSPLYYHSIYIDGPWEYKTNRVFESYAWKEGAIFVNRTQDGLTGAVHEHYFSSLREFVIWHYRYLGYEISDESHPYENEVNLRIPVA